MSITSRLAARLGLRDAESSTGSEGTTPAGVLPPSRGRSAGVTVGDATGLSAVYRAIAIWATAGSQLSVDVWRGTTPIDPQPAIVRKPDLSMPRSAFIELSITSLAGHGNAYWKLSRDDRGAVRTAQVLDPRMVTPLTSIQDGSTVTGYAYQGKTLTTDEVQHLQLLRMPGRSTGLGPIQAAQAELRGALDVQDYAEQWFDRGDIPPGYLSTDKPLTPDTAKATKEAWYEDRKRIRVLGSGLKFTPLTLNPKDAQWVESQNLSALKVARMYGIPPRLLLVSLDGSSDTYANLQDEDLSFVRWALAKPLREIEEAWTEITANGQTVRFNYDGILRADTEKRYTAHKLGIDAGWLLKSEVRAIEGLPPVAGIDSPKPAVQPAKDLGELSAEPTNEPAAIAGSTE
ncbi:phage portal protein [Curtobacterium sp. Csp2]|uniref:phage portal protein n=1 Tax=Curtobacterium sp. Csp2 TaxID=2495430 RepID=UPI001580A2FF|nr:phage portal protein [Curtobacterium sp. Csp2]QKS15603.1 phage portal protein [Curtobacterium sp. Csp2]